MSYQVTFTDTALKNLSRYPKKDQRLILESIEELASDPAAKSNVKKLVEFDVGYRLRVGSYRIFFEKEDKLRVIASLIF